MAKPLAIPRAIDPVEAASFHFVMRFAFSTAAAFLLCEWIGWQPAALAAILTGVLLANLPTSPPPKVGLALVTVMGLAAWGAFLCTTLLSQTPHILFGLIAIVLFVALANIAHGKGQLPMTLVILCFTVLPVMILAAPAAGARLTSVFARAMALAVIFSWIAFAIWPRASQKPADGPAGPAEAPLLSAAIGTAIIIPIMLTYLLMGITDAMPVLVTTSLLVAKMEEERGAATGRAKLVGNLLGGFIAVVAFYMLQVAPTLATLGLITFLIGIGFGLLIVKGGVQGGNALLAFNATMVIFGLAILKGPANSGTWSARIIQFVIAVVFAVGMMRLLMPMAKTKRSTA